MKMVLATRVDPRGMVRVFEKLEKEHHRQIEELKDDAKKADPKEKKPKEKSSKKKDRKEEDSEQEVVQEWMEYFSTHPANNNRVAVLKKMSENPAHKPKPLLPGFDWKSMHKETKESDESSFIF
jgi:Zn-dependent protease with chaperone function